MKPLLIKSIPYIILCMIAAGTAYSQTDTVNVNIYENLSLQDLLNVKIVSVSKKSEFLFDAPLSASVVTKEEIQRAGCTSIMEAMRLEPGIIVRQQSNGNYDIHLRGMDNVPPNGSFDIASTNTLVMIDNRPVYSYLRGGTFWETLPVDINDVERIEVVRGPAAALYGANAVNGVINIITRHTKKDGLYVVANNQQGSNQTFINNASIGFQSGKWSAIASGNYQHRDRSQTSYYEVYRNQWMDHPDYLLNAIGDTAKNISQRFPHQELAMKKYAGNVFLNYDPSEKIKFALSTGIQHSMVQKVSAENNITPFTISSSDSRYADLRINVKGISAQASYNGGRQNVDFNPGNKYDFSVVDANIEYNYTKNNFSLKPGFSYRNTVYDDTKYSDMINKMGIFNARGQITTTTASLRGEYKLINNKLRLIAGLAANKFNYPNETYISFEFAGTYKLNKNQLLRAVYSRAPRSSSIFDIYVDKALSFFPSGMNRFTRIALVGNKDLKLLTADMFEVGYRIKLNSVLNIDAELFNIQTKNSNNGIITRAYDHISGADTITELPIISTNLPLVVHQQGITVSITYSSKQWQLKPFITLQHTRIKNYTIYNTTPDAGFGPNNIYSGMGSVVTNKSTPTAFGGATVNYIPGSKFNFNLNASYYSAQTYYHLFNIIFNDGIRGIDHIDAKLILNASVSYKAAKGLRIFCSGKNILNDTSREFFKADEVPFMLLGGINYEF